MTNTPKYTRVFIGQIARWSRDRQLDKCREIEPKLQAIYEPHEFDDYLNNLRSDEAALMARLVAIAEVKPKKRPGIAFVLRLMQLLQKAAYIHDAETGIRSTDGQAWLDLVESTYNAITRGRELPSERAKVLQKLSDEAREPGLVSDWRSREGSPEYLAVASIWGNLSIKPAAKAIGMLPDKELQSVSPSTMKRIFGTRRECLDYLNNRT